MFNSDKIGCSVYFRASDFLLNAQSGYLIFFSLLCLGLWWNIDDLGWKFSLYKTRILFGSPIVVVIAVVIAITGFVFFTDLTGSQGTEGARANMQIRDVTYQDLANTRGDRLIPNSDGGRRNGWVAAFRMALDTSVVGPGPGTWSRRAALYYSDSVVASFFQYLQFAHNDLLQTAAEQGLFPLFAWIAIWWTAFKRQSERLLLDRRSELGVNVSTVGNGTRISGAFSTSKPCASNLDRDCFGSVLYPSAGYGGIANFVRIAASKETSSVAAQPPPRSRNRYEARLAMIAASTEASSVAAYPPRCSQNRFGARLVMIVASTEASSIAAQPPPCSLPAWSERSD